MERRIFGLENEYGVTCTFRGQRRLSPDEVARYLFRRVVHWGRSSNVFLENGARLYLDVGSHPEYATPECDDVRELVSHDKAGERILEHLLSAAEIRLHEEGISGEIWCGAGKVLHGPRGAQFCLAQRSEHIWEGVSSATTRSRPIINTRDEPHADAERYRRLHVIVGDSNMSEWTTFMKVGITDLVLRMVESNTVMRDLSLENPIRAIREISHDPTCTRKVRLANGRELSALEVQTEYHQKTARFIERRGADDTSALLLSEWGEALEALRVGDPDRLIRKVDWVTKRAMIERYMAKHDLNLGAPKVALLDLAYHDVNRARGLYYLLERAGKVERVVDDERVEIAMREPPQSTRAKLRGDFIREAKAKRRDYTVDWVHLKLNDQAQRTVLCKDPFRSVDERVEQLIAHM
jgi:proteasome accessory factor A